MSPVPDIQAHFDRIAAVYDGHAALEQEVCRRLAEHTMYQQREPSVSWISVAAQAPARLR